MSAALKYTLGRIGLFVAVLAGLWLVDMNMFLKLMLALVFSAALSFFLLRGWRDEMAEEMADRRRAPAHREGAPPLRPGRRRPTPTPTRARPNARTLRVDQEVCVTTRRVSGTHNLMIDTAARPGAAGWQGLVGYQLVEPGTLGQGFGWA